jgi:hypothetical protein
MGTPGWPAFIHYPDGTSTVGVLLEPPTGVGDRVVILDDDRPWIATDMKACTADFQGKEYTYNRQVWVERPGLRAAQ